MVGLRHLLIFSFTFFAFVSITSAQVDEICGETGATPWMNSSYVFGKVYLYGFARGSKLPKITVSLTDRQGAQSRLTIDRSGNYCFRGVNANGGSLVIDMEGVEVGRQTLPSGLTQHRQDFNVYNTAPQASKPPGVILAKFNYVRSEKNAKLFAEATQAEAAEEFGRALQILKDIVASDPNDFAAWRRLGGLQSDRKDFQQAETSYKRSIGNRADYWPAMVDLGRTYLQQSKTDEAIDIIAKGLRFEPSNAMGFRLLGEAFLLAKKGSLGVPALNEAIRLDPQGMAECHLLIANLYDRAGGKAEAAREFQLFLDKVPDHKDRKKLEKYIRDNGERP